jgi:hypothetical protein
MLAGANPVPQLDLVDVDVEAAAYLATLEQRSSEMTQLDTKPIEMKKSKQRRLALVLGIAIVAILIGGVLILTQGEETVPPATQLTPTTVASVETPTIVEEVIDPQVEEALSVATSFIEALMVGDMATAESFALDSVRLSLLGVENASTGPSGEVPWQEALGWDATLDECAVTTSGSTTTVITCTVTHSNDISRALDASPYTSTHRYTVMYEGGTYFGQPISKPTVVADGTDGGTEENSPDYVVFKAEVFDPFIAWLQANHPDDLLQVMWHATSIGVISPDGWMTGDFMPDHAPESIELWRQYSEEYIAQLGS